MNQLGEMDVICRRALLTIISAAGPDANAGLPRKEFPSTKVASLDLLALPTDGEYDVITSTWNSRSRLSGAKNHAGVKITSCKARGVVNSVLCRTIYMNRRHGRISIKSFLMTQCWILIRGFHGAACQYFLAASFRAAMRRL
jgi:hypothetical protein